MALNVANESRFNRLDFQNDVLKKILVYDEEEDFHEFPWTFSGMAIVDLDKLEKSNFGKTTSFFDSVANYKKYSVGISIPENLNYHDFGTMEYYRNSLIKLATVKRTFLNGEVLRVVSLMKVWLKMTYVQY